MSSASADTFAVEVAYARPDAQALLTVAVAPGATVGDVIKLSGILRQFPEIDLAVNKVGIFGKPSSLHAPVQGGDRVEIYRALIADPKEARKQRAARDRPAKKGGAKPDAG